MRHPHTTHHLGLADVAGGHPLDDLLDLLILFQHRDLPAVAPITGEPPARTARAEKRI
jgi:hypothetical protein